MGLDKYKFVPGEKYPAVNASSIDPDNIVEQTVGSLIGGTGHSLLSVFQSLASGANNGSFKINIDGTEHDNVTADLVKTAWVLTGTSEKNKYIAGTTLNQPRGLFFNSSGEKMFTADTIYINQFSLSTPWDASTITYEKRISVAYTLAGLHFSPDGTKMFVLSFNAIVYQFSLSTAFDIATASYDNVSFSLTGQMSESSTIKIKNDGTTFIVLKHNSRILYQYTMSTPWDLSTASYSGKSLTINGSYSSYYFDIRPDGTEIYIHTQYDNASLSKHTISTAWDLSTASASSSATVTLSESGIVSVCFKPDGSKMYSAKYQYVYQYATGTVVASLAEIATKFQSAIRAITGKTETVAYDTDHFVFTSSISGRSSKILKLMTPSAGTDISGAGAIPYLDCADNATEVLGDGDEFYLVRLDEDGKVPNELLNINIGTAPTAQTRVDNTVYQNTSKKSILVYAVFSITAGGENVARYAQVNIYVDSVNPPIKPILFGKENNKEGTIWLPFTFVVPSGYYYKFVTAANIGTISVYSWYECDLI